MLLLLLMHECFEALEDRIMAREWSYGGGQDNGRSEQALRSNYLQ
jgi:hypothetical protein